MRIRWRWITRKPPSHRNQDKQGGLAIGLRLIGREYYLEDYIGAVVVPLILHMPPGTSERWSGAAGFRTVWQLRITPKIIARAALAPDRNDRYAVAALAKRFWMFIRTESGYGITQDNSTGKMQTGALLKPPASERFGAALAPVTGTNQRFQDTTCSTCRKAGVVARAALVPGRDHGHPYSVPDGRTYRERNRHWGLEGGTVKPFLAIGG